MKVYVAFLTVLATLAMASPAKDGNLEARVDCSTCGCSSAESCTVSLLPEVNNYAKNEDMLRQYSSSM